MHPLSYRVRARSFLAVVCLAGSFVPGHAQDTPRPQEPKPAADLSSRDTLTGDWDGARPALAARGLTFNFNYIGEALGNFRGGERRLGVYEGRFEMTFEADLEKAIQWPGAVFHVTGYQIQGRGLSAKALGNLLTASGIEAERSSRLFTLWLEQNWANKQVSLRMGQIAADDEFATSPAAATFVNGTFGWPGILAANLTSGGPTYPLAAPGARLRLQPSDNLLLQAAVFSGDPAGTGSELDPQLRNRSGTRFSFAGGTFVVAEAALGSDGGWIGGLPGTAKAGFWYHSGGFDDQRFDTLGLSLADPASSGIARRRRGNTGAYAMFDQALWRVEGSKERGLDAFLRVGANPSGRNLVGWYVDAGLALRGALDARPADVMGLAFGFARIGDAARARDRDALSLAGATTPVRDFEAVLELTYVALIAPWWTLQPDLQLIFHPGANAANPRDANRAVIKDAVVLGLRTTVTF